MRCKSNDPNTLKYIDINKCILYSTMIKLNFLSNKVIQSGLEFSISIIGMKNPRFTGLTSNTADYNLELYSPFNHMIAGDIIPGITMTASKSIGNIIFEMSCKRPI